MLKVIRNFVTNSGSTGAKDKKPTLNFVHRPRNDTLHSRPPLTGDQCVGLPRRAPVPGSPSRLTPVSRTRSLPHPQASRVLPTWVDVVEGEGGRGPGVVGVTVMDRGSVEDEWYSLT